MSSLKSVPEQEWIKVRDIYKKDWPYGIYPYYVMENFISWKKKGFDNQFNVYCLDGRYEDGTTIMVSILGETQNIHVFTYEKSCERLKEALKKCKSIFCWTIEIFFYGVHREHFPHVDETLKKLGLTTDFEVHSGYHWISKEKALQLEIEELPGVYIADLTEKDVTHINEIWPHKYPGSDYYLKVCVDWNGGLGVFSKSDNSLCCWILKNHLYGLGILQTLDEHKRKGYARLITKTLTKKMASEGLDIHTCIVRKNEVSQNLFKDIGFEYVDDVICIKYLGVPKDEIE